VTSVPTGEPLKGAQVYLTAPEKYKALYRAETDTTGGFSIENVEPGTYQLKADKTGYYDPARGCDSADIQSGDVIKLAPGQRLSEIKLQLSASAVITGTVFNPKGEPLPDADVEAVQLYSYRGQRTLGNAVSPKTTNDRGEFRIYHLQPGKYFVRVSDAFYFRNESDVEEDDPAARQVKGFLPIYYPDTSELTQATIIELKPGEELAQINFTVHLTQVLRIRGSVVSGLTGEPITNGSVAIGLVPPAIRENGGGAMSIAEDSHFEVKDLVPGKYIVSAHAWVVPERRVLGGWRQIELTDSSLDDVQIRVFPSQDITGRVELPGGKKIEAGHLQIQLDPHDDLVYGSAFTNVKADGTFIIPDVKQDSYDLGLSGLPDGYYLKSAALGTLDATDGLRVGVEAITVPLVIHVSPSGAKVDGVVMTGTGKPACSATVVLVPDGSRRSRRRLYQEADVDRSGHFEMLGIVPGDYKLFAFDHAENVGYMDAGSLSVYANQGQAVHFDEGDRRTVPLKVILTGSGSP